MNIIKVIKALNTDDGFDVFINGAYVMHFDHDLDGWDGMMKAERLLEEIAMILPDTRYVKEYEE